MEEKEKPPVETKDKESPDFFQNKYIWIIGVILLIIVGWFGLKVLFAPFDNYKITLVDAPETVAAENTATFTWRIDGPPTTINHTDVHLGTVSNPGEIGSEVSSAETSYTDNVKDFADGELNIPLQFVGNIKMDKPPGKYYFRVHALIKDKNYWTDEYSLLLTEPAVAKPSVTAEPSEAAEPSVTMEPESEQP